MGEKVASAAQVYYPLAQATPGTAQRRPISPHISPYLPISPHISLYLSRRRWARRSASTPSITSVRTRAPR